MAWGKESRQARGYGAAWEKLRAQILRRDRYICHCPECLGGQLRLRPANEVDHIKPKAWFKAGRAKGDPDHPSNLRAVNHDCHVKLTQAQRGCRPAVRIGTDGFPIVE